MAPDRRDRPRRSLVVLSPHLDDGVLSCGDVLASRPGAVVLTVFAGCPPDDAASTEWDRASGFATAREAVDARRAEDAEALAALGARPHWLDWCDAQYGTTRHPGAVARSIAAVLGDIPSCDGVDVFAPLGLFHDDHVLVGDVALALLEDTGSAAPDTAWYLYADALYRTLDDQLEHRLARVAGELRRRGRALTPVAPAPPNGAKARAVAAYRSQLRALATPGRPGHQDAFTAECYWAVTP